MHKKIRRALVIDNDKVSRKLIRTALMASGCAKIVELDDASLAFGTASIINFEDGIAKEGSTDIVLMERIMPTMDGLKCSKLIRSGALDGFDSTAPIILLAKNVDLDYERLAMSAGITTILWKPFSLRAISSAIQHALQKRGLVETMVAEGNLHPAAISGPIPSFS